MQDGALLRGGERLEERIWRRHDKGPGRRKKVIIRSSEGGRSREENEI
jgi:hypothetical protein